MKSVQSALETFEFEYDNMAKKPPKKRGSFEITYLGPALLIFGLLILLIIAIVVWPEILKKLGEKARNFIPGRA